LRVVLDTNVLVSGLISPSGPPGEIVRLLGSAPIVPCYNESILGEYREVLGRPKFGFPEATVARLIRRFSAVGERVAPELPWPKLPDPKDEVFLAVALAAHADFLVTGNLRHFPPHLRHGVAVVSPRNFLESFR
jgi:putative PIN family toxin of toxin-antitoxin system